MKIKIFLPRLSFFLSDRSCKNLFVYLFFGKNQFTENVKNPPKYINSVFKEVNVGYRLKKSK